MAPNNGIAANAGIGTQRSRCRQVLECGDGVRAVTALAGTLELLRLTADTHNPTQSGDSADSVAAVQDASRADWIRPRFMVPICHRKSLARPVPVTRPKASYLQNHIKGLRCRTRIRVE